MKNTGEGLSSIYTLGVFPCDGKTQHANYGLSDDWADLEKFTAKALSLFQERFNVSETPTEVPLVDKKRIAFVKERQKAWWEFWKK
jgi:hypothetical protein